MKDSEEGPAKLSGEQQQARLAGVRPRSEVVVQQEAARQSASIAINEAQQGKRNTYEKLKASAFEQLELQWPHFKFMGFGFFYAWIFLEYNSNVMSSMAHTQMYLASTLSVSIVLVLCALAHKRIKTWIRGLHLPIIMGVLALMATLGTSLSWNSGAPLTLFYICAAGTGVTTAFVVLRHGYIYGQTPIRDSFPNICASIIVASVCYFVIVALPETLALVLTSCLPLFSVCMTLPYGYTLFHKDPDAQSEGVVPMAALGRGFFVRMLVAVVAFSLIVGYVRGDTSEFASLVDTVHSSVDTLIIFFTMATAVVFYFLAGVLPRRVDISAIYSPVIVITAFGVGVMPLLGDGWLSSQLVVGVAYNVFIMFIFCILSHVSYRTDLNFVLVFGLGRGASSLGTTVGWAIGSDVAAANMLPIAEDTINIVLCFILVFVALVLLSQGSIEHMLRNTVEAEAEMESGDPDGLEDDRKHARRWMDSCDSIAECCKLSAREKEVFILLSKGRTIEAIADELTVSFNTAKTHIKHVYSKCGVHSRLELVKMVEDAIKTSR